MKKFLIALTGLATLVTTSAYAQSMNDRVRHTVKRPGHYITTGQYVTNDPYIVIANDHVVGRDPDPNVREQMRRDPVMNEY